MTSRGNAEYQGHSLGMTFCFAVAILILMLGSLAQFFQNFILAAVYHDRVLFHRINEEWTNSFFDSLLPFVTDAHHAVYAAALAVAVVVWKLRWRTFPVLLGCILAVSLSDLTAARLIKPLVKRDRPQITEPHIRLLVPSQRSYGFPSNHAANIFAAAAFFSFTVPVVGILGTLVAFFVAYSRVYVGVHYPLDVLFGALLGLFWAAVVFKLYVFLDSVTNPIREESIAPKDWRKVKYYKKTKKKIAKPETSSKASSPRTTK